jgi:lysyl-tRNA synthetase class 2
LLVSSEGKIFRDINDIIPAPVVSVVTAGRLMLYRTHGKLSFGKLLDGTGQIQLMFHRDNCKIRTLSGLFDMLPMNDSEEISAYNFMEKMVDIGDFLGVKGELFFTHKGELTIFVSEFSFLSKAVRPLPEKFHGLQDQEEIYRKRYLDMTTNPDAYKRFVLRSEFVRHLRAFYHEHGFIEIETPTL